MRLHAPTRGELDITDGAALGQRLRSGIPHGHWLTTTFVAGLRLSGMSAPIVLDGPMTRDWFLAVKQR
ncbi:hypothetical protein ABID43_005240 [Methylobacterium goesingense]|uniref:Uncharacterized protein n=1 Tax=Methylobacterium goesingense TaxID=243690 RepID=A0ABV2LCS7_9HYPH